MAKRSNHYEAAFEAWLRERGIPYVAVDESRRSRLGEASVKNLDFIVSPTVGQHSWLVDVKGRRFPSGQKSKQYWRNWTTRDELQSMSTWGSLFGPQFAGCFVFAYHLVGDRAPTTAESIFSFRGELYAFVAIRLEHYASWARPLSVRWNTVTMPIPRFRELARPAAELLPGCIATQPSH